MLDFEFPQARCDLPRCSRPLCLAATAALPKYGLVICNEEPHGFEAKSGLCLGLRRMPCTDGKVSTIG